MPNDLYPPKMTPDQYPQASADDLDTPAEAHPEQPAADAALGWLPLGQTVNDAVRVETNTRGGATLRLSLASTRTTSHDQDSAQLEAAGRVRTKTMDLLTASDAFRRLSEVRPQYRAVVKTLEEATRKASDCARRKADLERLTPAPSNLAARLVKAGADLDQAAAERKAKQAELDDITPLYRRSADAVRAAVPEALKTAYRAAQEEMQREALDRLRAVAESCRDDLTALFLLRRGEAGLAGVRPAELERLLVDGPDDPGE